MTYLTANGAELYYEDEGDGRPLFFLHGWGTSARVWNAQLPEFVRDHRVVTVDWRGCGRSERTATGTTIAGVVSDLVTVIDRLGLEAPIVVGSSIGAVYAAELALRYPDRVAQVVSVDSPGYWPAQACRTRSTRCAPHYVPTVRAPSRIGCRIGTRQARRQR